MGSVSATFGRVKKTRVAAKFLPVLIFASASLFRFSAHAGNRIEDVPELASVLIHHFECESAIVLADTPLRRARFRIAPPSAVERPFESTISTGDDTLSAFADGRQLRLDWTRRGRAVASAWTMIQDSPTQGFVLIIYDPTNSVNQANVTCSAVTYAELTGAVK